MVSYTWATRKGEDNIINYDVSANHLWCNIVFNKKKVRKSGFQTGSILSVGPQNPVRESGRDFYFLLLTSSLLPQIKFDTWFLGSTK